MPKTLLILGGYGNTGRLIADLLLRETDCHIIIAGRNLDRAKQQAESLNQMHNSDRATSRQVDAASAESLNRAFADIDLVVVASSTTAYVEQVARAAIHARIDYIDTQLSDPHKIQTLQFLEPDIKNADCCFVTDGGFHPGVPAALVRYATSQCDELHTANVYSAIQLNWKVISFSSATAPEMMAELRHMQPLIFTEGQWQKQSWSTYRAFDFGDPFHTRSCVPMFLEELRDLPEQIPGLRETGFFIAGFDPVTDYIVMPLGFIALNLFPNTAVRPIGKLFEWSVQTFSKPPFGVVLSLDATGTQNGSPTHLRIDLSHKDGYVLTAVPIVACLNQILDNTARTPGLHFQAHIVDPARFLTDLKHLGIQASIR